MLKPLAGLVGAYLVLMGFGTAISVIEELPYGFGHGAFPPGSPDDVLRDWAFGFGTALSPPLAVFVVLSLAAGLLFTRWRAAAAAALAVTAFGCVIGALGEPITWAIGPPRPAVHTAIAWTGVLLSMLIWALAVGEVSSARRRTPSP